MGLEGSSLPLSFALSQIGAWECSSKCAAWEYDVFLAADAHPESLRRQIGGSMPTPTLIPGSIVTYEGIYLVSHSGGERPNTECFLPKGLLLPSCGNGNCHVVYTFVRDGSFVTDKQSEEN